MKMQSPSLIRYLRANPNATEEQLMLREEAEHFARCLLMPKEIIEEFWDNFNTFPSLYKFYFFHKKLKIMANIFNVPIDEMRYRLYELGLID